MIRYKWYRWIQVMLGSRSFELIKDVNGVKQVSHLIVKNSSNKMVDLFIRDGWIEEWPIHIIRRDSDA